MPTCSRRPGFTLRTLLSLVVESSGGRVARYEHNFQRVVVACSEQSAVILGLLMLRGPQTARASCALTPSAGTASPTSRRWKVFSTKCRNAAEAKGGPLVVKLPRAPGAA